MPAAGFRNCPGPGRSRPGRDRRCLAGLPPATSTMPRPSAGAPSAPLPAVAGAPMPATELVSGHFQPPAPQQLTLGAPPQAPCQREPLRHPRAEQRQVDSLQFQAESTLLRHREAGRRRPRTAAPSELPPSSRRSSIPARMHPAVPHPNPAGTAEWRTAAGPPSPSPVQSPCPPTGAARPEAPGSIPNRRSTRKPGHPSARDLPSPGSAPPFHAGRAKQRIPGGLSADFDPFGTAADENERSERNLVQADVKRSRERQDSTRRCCPVPINR